MTMEERNFRYSTVREQMLEHLFISDLMQEAWFGRRQLVEVLRSEVDSSGYDLVVECNGITRHVQLKSSLVDSRTKRFSVSQGLADKPSGCVIWVRLDTDDLTKRKAQVEYRFFGKGPGEKLHSLEAFDVTRHPRGNKNPRPGHYDIPVSQFERLDGIEALAIKLFGLPKKEHAF